MHLTVTCRWVFRPGQVVRFVPTGELARVQSDDASRQYTVVVFEDEPAWLSRPVMCWKLEEVGFGGWGK